MGLLTTVQALADRELKDSRFVHAFYGFTVGSRNPLVKVLGLQVIAATLLLRSSPLYLRQLPLAVVACAVLVALLGPVLAAVLLYAAAILALLPSLRDNFRVNVGHRCGAEGFDGDYASRAYDPHLLANMQLPPGAECENTLEALAALLARDRPLRGAGGGGLPELLYVEFDVRETLDGELIVFHDADVRRAFTFSGRNVARLKAMGMDITRTLVQDLTLAQLRELDVGGRPGVKVPTLEAMLRALREAACPASVAVEVKRLQSDACRARLIRLCKEYKDAFAADPPEGGAARLRPDLGVLSVISFPHFFATSFGELGGEQWQRWAAEFVKAGVPARSCMFHWIDLLRGC